MNGIIEKNTRALLVFCVALYVLLRLIAWHNTVLLDDHDSTFYLKSINAYQSLDLRKINALSAYSTPVYPFLSAMIAKAGLSIETSARLCSFLFSMALFAAFYGVARKVSGNVEAVLGLFILSVSPALLPISYAILTEPSYIATIYIGLLVFLRQLGTQSLAASALLGLVFGLAFLNRTEGILFLLVIPLMQAFYLLFKEKRVFPLARYLGWCSVYGLVFLVLALPQIWHVSEKMGALALNGRIAWELLENSDIGRSGEEKQYGLHFRKDETNISFARRNYQEAKRLLQGSEQEAPRTNYVKRAYKNTVAIIRLIAKQQLGKIGSALALLGAIVLFISGRKIETLLILLFAASNLAGPLLHADDVYTRHVIGVIPALVLFQAIGAVYLARLVARKIPVRYLNRDVVVAVIVFASVLFAARPLYRAVLKPPAANYEYSVEEIRRPVEIISEVAKRELGRQPVVTARKNYIAYYSGAQTVYLPYAEYGELVQYLRLNNVDFLYLSYDLIDDYPFLRKFEQGRDLQDFNLLFEGANARGGKIQLYRLINGKHE